MGEEAELLKFGGANMFSGWIRDDQEAFDSMRKSMVRLAKEFKTTLESSGVNINGLEIHYHDLDSDAFDYDVRKWMVSIKNSEVEGIVESMDELYETEVYCVIDIETEQEIYYGSYCDCIEEIKTMFPESDINNESDTTEIAKKIAIEFKESYPHIVLT